MTGHLKKSNRLGSLYHGLAQHKYNVSIPVPKSYSNLQAVFYVFMAVVMTLRGGFTLLVRSAEFWNVIGVTVKFAFTQ